MAELIFPKRNTKFRLLDFFQTDVDSFDQGQFMFLSAKKVKVNTNQKLLDQIESTDEYGWIISTWCYTCKYFYKIFVCDYKQKPWANNYHIRSAMSIANGCTGYAVHSTIEDFIEWMEF